MAQRKSPLLLTYAEKYAARHLHLIHIDGRFYNYIDGVYRPIDAIAIKKELLQIIGPAVRPKLLDEAVGLLAIMCSVESARLYHVGRIINLHNGLLDLDAGFKPHASEFISFVQIPVDYDPEAQCPLWTRCLGEWFADDPDCITLLQEFFGYCLIPDTSHHKALLFVGVGNNGKSVVCWVLILLVGPENVAHVSLNALNRSFAAADLEGKLVNVSTEAEVKGTLNEELFKSIVSGDPIRAERKFQDPFNFTPFVRFVIATNNLFNITDRSEGIFRRLLIVPFTRSIPEDQVDRELKVKLETERAGILNWSIQGLRRLEAQGRFTMPRTVQEAIDDYRKSNDPVGAWLDDRCELDPDAETKASELYNSYKFWAADSGYRAMAIAKFGQELRRRGLEPGRSSNRHSRKALYRGIRLLPQPPGRLLDLTE